MYQKITEQRALEARHLFTCEVAGFIEKNKLREKKSYCISILEGLLDCKST